MIEITVLASSGRSVLNIFNFFPRFSGFISCRCWLNAVGAVKSPVYQAAADYLCRPVFFAAGRWISCHRAAGAIMLLMFCRQRRYCFWGASGFCFQRLGRTGDGAGFGLRGFVDCGQRQYDCRQGGDGHTGRNFLPMVIVDTVVPYVWMGTLVSLVTLQPYFDRWSHREAYP